MDFYVHKPTEQVKISPIIITSLGDESSGILSATWVINEDVYIDEEDIWVFRNNLARTFEIIADDVIISFQSHFLRKIEEQIDNDFRILIENRIIEDYDTVLKLIETEQPINSVKEIQYFLENYLVNKVEPISLKEVLTYLI